MPGPSNVKKKRKSHGKQQKKKISGGPRPLMSASHATEQESPSTSFERDQSSSPVESNSPTHPLTPPQPVHLIHTTTSDVALVNDNLDGSYLAPIEVVPQLPFIYDPGNGPRVRDTRAFLASKYFSQPPALDIPLCAEFAQEEVLQMLMTVLPEETALILWYNKSRASSRICPACQRLYRLGDILPELIDDDAEPRSPKPPSPQLRREQELSGLCSPVCFILASFNYPGAIRSTWGRMEDELDDSTWHMLNGPPEPNAKGDVGLSLGMLMKMTRLHDLGLAQLCLGVDHGSLEDGGYYDDWDEDAPR